MKLYRSHHNFPKDAHILCSKNFNFIMKFLHYCSTIIGHLLSIHEKTMWNEQQTQNSSMTLGTGKLQCFTLPLFALHHLRRLSLSKPRLERATHSKGTHVKGSLDGNGTSRHALFRVLTLFSREMNFEWKKISQAISKHCTDIIKNKY